MLEHFGGHWAIVMICRCKNKGDRFLCLQLFLLISRLWLVNSSLRTRADDHNRRSIRIKRMQNWSKLVFVLILCNSLIVTGEKKNPTPPFLRYRVVPARQVPFPGSPEGSPGNGTWLAGTTLSRRMTAWDYLKIVALLKYPKWITDIPVCNHLKKYFFELNE